MSATKQSLAVKLLVVGVVVLLGLMPSGCTHGPPSAKITAVTTSNIVADWVKKVVGDHVEVFSLLPPGTDPHTFQPGAGDVAVVARAQVVFTVGLSMEGAWLNRLLENASASPGRVKALGSYVDPLPAQVEYQSTGKGTNGQYDPHFWWDPTRVKMAVEEIARQFTLADPGNANTYSENKASYLEELDKLDSRIKQRITQIPEERRKLVTSHETMQYFGARYGLEAVGSIFTGVTTEQEPSPSELTDLTKKIEALGVPAIFTETTVSDRLARAIATETGIKVVRLYSDSLGLSGSGADTYISMMDTDTELIVNALK